MARANENVKAVRHSKAKVAVLIVSLILVIGLCIGGTLAWLIANPDPAVNTFTYGDINIELDETDTELDDDDDPNTNEYKMLPGEEIAKDPVITVKAESEELWLFVKLEKSDNFDDFLEYATEEGWEALEGEDGVYYRHVTAEEVATADKKFHVLEEDKVTVKESVTKEMLNSLDFGETPTYPTLTVTAYAVQYSGFEPEVSEGATEATPEQINAAALAAWEAAEEETAPENNEPTE